MHRRWIHVGTEARKGQHGATRAVTDTVPCDSRLEYSCPPIFLTEYPIMAHQVLLLPGDGIGPEIVGAASEVLHALHDKFGLDVELGTAPMGGGRLTFTVNHCLIQR